ncbi:MAG: CHAT domain-containing protein [Bacteroidota bacterium]
MKLFFSTCLLLLSVVLHAQNNWKLIAREYLSLVQGENAWLMEGEAELMLDSTITQIIAEFNPQRQNRYLLQLLANLSIQRNTGDYNQYLESAMLAHRSDATSKALLLMEYSRYTLDQEDSPFYKDLLDSASSILTSLPSADIGLNIRLLQEYASLYPYDDAAVEPISQLNEALKLCSDSIGKNNLLYLSLLQDLSLFHARNGDTKKHYQLEKEILNLNLNDLGAAHLDLSAFPFRQPDLSKIPLSRIRSAYLLMAQMYEQTSDSYFNGRMAAKLYELASKYQKPPKYEIMADFALTVGQRYVELEEYSRAVGYLKKAVKNYEKVSRKPLGFANKKEVSEMLLAKAYYGAGQYEQALRLFGKYDSLYEKQKDYRKSTIHNMILTNYQLGNESSVEKFLNLFLQLKGDYVDDNDPALFAKYGRIKEEMGDKEGAYQFYKLAYDEFWSLATFERMKFEEETSGDEPETFGEDNLILTLDSGNAAFTVYDQASFPMGTGYVNLLRPLAEITYETGRYTECMEYIEKYVNRYYTQLHFDRQNASYAGLRYGSDLNELYKLKELLFPFYDLYLLSAIRSKDTDSDEWERNVKVAYNQVIDAKANIQFEYRHMMMQIAESEDSTLQETFREYIALRDELAEKVLAGDEDLEDLKSKINTLQLILSAESAVFKPVDKQFVFWQDVRKTLKKQEALIEIKRVEDPMSGKTIYTAFLTTSTSKYPWLIQLSDGQLMENEAVNSYRNAIKSKAEDSKSYDVFWKSFEPYLKDIKKIYFAPDGVYHQLNVSTLYNKKRKKYVVDNYQITRIISGKQLTENSRKIGKVKKATLIGRPAFSTKVPISDDKSLPLNESPERSLTRDQLTKSTIQDLPETEAEVKNIDQILRKKKISTDLFLGVSATEANFKQSAGQLIHIATHGFWFEESTDAQADAMFQSGLVLAGAKNYKPSDDELNDGLLTAYEIQGLSLQDTQLAVLSASDTGLGKLTNGEGVFGLQRAFTIAGVDQLLMSLWKVDDEATQQLFTVFYKEWIQKGKEISEAFATAQKAIRKKYKHPYYWGAFVLID